jgi:hypothetical protein
MRIPHAIVATRGCDCRGSLDLHHIDCAIHKLTRAEYDAAVTEARQRLFEYTAGTYQEPHG